MRQQIRIQSVHGSIGPVRKANAGRGGEKTGEPEEAASAEGAGRSTAQERRRKEKAKREGSEGSRVFDLCDLTRQVKNPRSKTQAQRRRKGKAKKERAEREEEGRAQL